MPTPTAAELIAQYTEYCTLLRVRKPCSAVLGALKRLHDEQAAAQEAHASAAAAAASQRSHEAAFGESSNMSDGVDSPTVSGGRDIPGSVASPPVPPPLLRLPALRALDLGSAYLGGRGLLAVASLCRHLPDLEWLDVSDAQWFNCDGRPNAPGGHETLTLFCKLLVGHPRLGTLELGTVDFGPSQYLWLVELLKGTPTLVDLHLEAPNLEEREAKMLEALCAVNAKRLERRQQLGGFASGRYSTADVSAQQSPSHQARGSVAGVDVPGSSDALVGPTDGGGADEDAMTDVGSSRSFLGLALAKSVVATMRAGGPSGVEAVVRAMGEPTAAVLVGPPSGARQRPGKLVPTPAPPKQSAEVAHALHAAFARNGILRHVPEADRAPIVAAMRRAIYAEDEIILESGDAIDGVGILTAGGAVSIRSDDVSMHHPCGGLVGEEELMPGMLTDTRRFTVRAAPSLVAQPLRCTVLDRDSKRARRGTQPYVSEAESPAVLPGVSVANASVVADANDGSDGPAAPVERVEVWWIPRHVFASQCVRRANDNRQHWRRLVDLLPSMQGLGTMAKLAVADALDERKAPAGEVLSAGFAMLADVFIVVDGSATVYFQHTQLKKLVRGELFACHPKTDVARCSVVANDPGAVIAFIAPHLFRSLPRHVQEHVAALARTYTLMDSEAPA